MSKTIEYIICALVAALDRQRGTVLPLVARAVFALTLFAFFWKSAKTKLGEGILGFLSPSAGAYAQIFPAKFEAAGYDTAAMSIIDWAVVMAGTYGEFILPVLIVIGLATRLAALGMIVFIVVMSVVDVTGHGVVMGSLLDGNPMSLIPDQRLYWMIPLLILVFTGGGPVSADRFVMRYYRQKG